jgi:hypothetical protein
VSRLFVPAVVALALIAAPAAAQEEPEPTPPCETSEEYVTLGIDGKTEEVDSPPLPSAGQRGEPFDTYSVTNYRYRLDVSGSEENPFATRANVSIDLEWDNDGDNELRVYDSTDSLLGSSTDFMPDYIETVFLIGVPHCTDLRAEIENFLAPPDLNMTLTSRVSSLKP